MKGLIHKFLASGWVVQNQFMELDNSYEVVVHYLLIRGMTSISHQNEFSIMSASVYMVTHWIGPMVNHDINYQVVMISPNYYVTRPFNLERILSSTKIFNDFDL